MDDIQSHPLWKDFEKWFKEMDRLSRPASMGALWVCYLAGAKAEADARGMNDKEYTKRELL